MASVARAGSPVLVMLPQASGCLVCGRGCAQGWEDSRPIQSPFPSSTSPVWHWPGVLGSQFSKGSLRLAEGEAAGLALLR